jgi:hypothetical protein
MPLTPALSQREREKTVASRRLDKSGAIVVKYMYPKCTNDKDTNKSFCDFPRQHRRCSLISDFRNEALRIAFMSLYIRSESIKSQVICLGRQRNLFTKSTTTQTFIQ